MSSRSRQAGEACYLHECIEVKKVHWLPPHNIRMFLSTSGACAVSLLISGKGVRTGDCYIEYDEQNTLVMECPKIGQNQSVKNEPLPISATDRFFKNEDNATSPKYLFSDSELKRYHTQSFQKHFFNGFVSVIRHVSYLENAQKEIRYY